MFRYREYLFGLVGCLAASAAGLTPGIRVTSETTPPGGMAQVKVLLTSPMPIMSGGMRMDMSSVSFDSIDGIALFSDTGDVAGAAVVNGGAVSMQFTSPHGTFGTTGYPLMTIALRLSPTVQNGQVFPVILDPNASFWQNLVGSPIPLEIAQGSITVGGSVSVTNVLPGGGPIAAGASFLIQGVGFNSGTKVSLNGLNLQSTRYLSPTQILATVKDAGAMDGLKIMVQNPDKSTDTYYSYLRGVSMGRSTRPLLAQTVPAFSTNTIFEALVPPTISPMVNPDYFTALALQNPSAASANVTVETHSGNGAVTGSATLVLPPGSRISREVSEWFGSVLPTGGYLRVVSDHPVQMLGLLGNDRTGIVLPVSPVVISAPAPPPPPPPTPAGSGKGH